MHYNPRLFYSNWKIHEFIIPTFLSFSIILTHMTSLYKRLLKEIAIKTILVLLRSGDSICSKPSPDF